MEATDQKRTRRLEAKRAEYQRHRAERLEQQKAYRLANAAEIAAKDSARRKRYREQDPEKFRARDRDWSVSNAEKVKAKTSRWLEQNADRKRETNRAWKLANQAKVKQQSRDWWAENRDRAREYARLRRSTPQGKIEASVRAGITGSLRRKAGRKGKSKTFDALCYTVTQLIEHLERQFVRGMSWDNYGEWHVDHILPVASFNYDTTDDPEFRAAWALSNLRPLWKTDNLVKGAKRLTLL